MERQLGKPLHIQAAEAFESPAFLQKLGMARADAERIFGGADWHQLLRDLVPIRGRISCADAWRPSAPCWTRWRRIPLRDGCPTPTRWPGRCCIRRRTPDIPPPSGMERCAFCSCSRSCLTRSGPACPLTSGWTLILHGGGTLPQRCGGGVPPLLLPVPGGIHL